MTEFCLEEVDKKIHENAVTICVCYASWKDKGSRELLAALEAESFSDDVSVILLSMDDDEEQEVALGLNMTEIPSVHIYKKGGKLYSVLIKGDLRLDKIKQIVFNLQQLVTLSPPTESEKLLQAVSESYAGTLKGTQGKVVNMKGCCCSMKTL